MRTLLAAALVSLFVCGPSLAQTLTLMDQGSSLIYEEGWALARAGDMNGDGVTDVLVGCTDSSQGAGTVKVLSMPDGVQIWAVTGEAAGDRFGAAVAGGQDVDQDGTPDFIVGAPGWDLTNIFDNRGKIYVYSGATGNLIWQETGTASMGQLGTSVALLPDLNGDGHAEFAAGAPLIGGAIGSVVIYSGITGQALTTLNGEGPGQQFGTSVAAAGDLNGDAIGDLLVGAPYQAVNGTAGRAYVYSGSDWSLVRTLDGQQGNEQFGWSVASAGDLNGDQVPDILVGAPGYNAGANQDAGRARAYSGSTGAYFFEVVGPHVYMKAGVSVDGVMDLDGDGGRDVLVGMPYIPP